MKDKRTHSLAKSVTPLSLRLYALSKGWNTDDRGYEHGIYLMTRPEDGLRQIQIPMANDSDGSVLAIVDVAEKMSQIERRSAANILADSLFVGADIIRFGVSSTDSAAGVLSLDGGIQLLEGAKQSILASACSVAQPARFHKRLAQEEAKLALQACKMDQTEYGSFIVKVACPLDAVQGPAAEPVEHSFVRRSTQLLLKSASKLITSIQRNDLSEIEGAADDASLVSANFCEALVKMGEADEGGTLGISATWSGLAGPPDEGTPSVVRIAPEYFPIIQNIGDKLRGRIEARPDIFVGTVEELRGEIKDGRRAGEVVLSIMFEERLVSAKVWLDSEQHRIADEAYMRCAQVRVRGVFEQGGRVHTIKNVEEFGFFV